MADDGLKTGQLPEVELIDDLLGNRDGSASRISTDKLAAQLAETGAMAEKFSEYEEGVDQSLSEAQQILEQLELIKIYIGSAVVPIGNMTFHYFDEVPDGWLLVNGQPVTPDMPDLRQKLIDDGAPLDGNGDPLLDDPRGRVVRIWDPDGNLDPEVARAIRSFQGDALGAHTHDVKDGTGGSQTGSITAGGGNFSGQNDTGEWRSSEEYTLIAEAGGPETRMANVAYPLIIKAYHAYANLAGKIVPLGTAAEKDVEDFATPEQGAKADTAIQECYPFHSAATGVDPAARSFVLDAYFEGVSGMKLALFTADRNGAFGWYVRITAYKDDDTLDTAVGDGGVIAVWGGILAGSHTEPPLVAGRRIEVLELEPAPGSPLTFGRLTVDWEALEDSGGDPAPNPAPKSWVKGGFAEACFLRDAPRQRFLLDRRRQLNEAPENPYIWRKANVFSDGFADQLILDCHIWRHDPTKRYGLEIIAFGPAGGRSFIGIAEYDAAGVFVKRVSLWDDTSYAYPTETQDGLIDTVITSPQGGTNIRAEIKINWRALIERGALDVSGNVMAGYPTDFATERYTYTYTGDLSTCEFSQEILDEPGPGTNFDGDIDGVPFRVRLPNNYRHRGGADARAKLALYMHGNGQNYAFVPSAAARNYLDGNGCCLGVINGQDEKEAPFTSAASGWGNDIYCQRYLKLWQWMQANLNVERSALMLCGSMGGLAHGKWAASPPIPVRGWIAFGPVPSLAHIFARGGESRRAPIRNAYGMASDGSEDDQLLDFIKGHDWYDFGLPFTADGVLPKVEAAGFNGNISGTTLTVISTLFGEVAVGQEVTGDGVADGTVITALGTGTGGTGTYTVSESQTLGNTVLAGIPPIMAKVGFPNFYVYAGSADTTFDDDFGGAVNYPALKDAFEVAGARFEYTVDPALTHADADLWDQAISDGVFDRLLGKED